MMEWAISKLDELRHRMPEAGGLIIAPDIEMAEYMSAVIEMLEGDKPVMFITGRSTAPESNL